jgi:competence protein ComEA
MQGRKEWCRYGAAIGIAVALLFLPLVAQGAAAPAATPEKIDVNRATSAELESLPGVGPSLAQRILDYRKEHGPFQRIEDLMNVQGIGEKNFLRIREHVTVGERKPDKG